MLQRRHHCRHCGRVICGKCGKKKHRVALLKYGYHEPVRVCVSCHDVCTQSEELMTAISANGYVAVEGLLDAGADPNFSTLVFTPFMHAASKGHTKLMQLLRERGADSQYTVPRLEAPITSECENCSKVTTHEFNSLHTYQCPHCKHKAFEFSEAHACVGMSAIHAAAAKGQTKAVQWLLQNGLSIHAHTAVGDTPLMMAVMGGHRETVEHLLDNGADITAVNADGDSALHRAVSEGAQNIVRLLLQGGASLTAKNREGLTPVQVADEKGDTQIIDILSRHADRATLSIIKGGVAAEGSFGYQKWQTKDHPSPPAPSGGCAGGRAAEDGGAAAGGNPVVGAAEGAGAADDALGEWGKAKSALATAANGVGMSGVAKDKMEPFKWDDSIPKLADRRSVPVSPWVCPVVILVGAFPPHLASSRGLRTCAQRIAKPRRWVRACARVSTWAQCIAKNHIVICKPKRWLVCRICAHKFCVCSSFALTPLPKPYALWVRCGSSIFSVL